MLPLWATSQTDTVQLKQEISTLQDSAKKFLDGLFDARSFSHSLQARRETKGRNINALKEKVSGTAFDPVSNIDDDAFWPRLLKRSHGRVVQASNSWVKVDIVFTPVDSHYTVKISYALSDSFIAMVDTSAYYFQKRSDSLVNQYFRGKKFVRPRDAPCYEYCAGLVANISRGLNGWYDKQVASSSGARGDWNNIISSIVGNVDQRIQQNQQIIAGSASGNVSYVLRDVPKAGNVDLGNLDMALRYVNLTSRNDVVLVVPKIGFAIPRDSLSLFSEQIQQQLKVKYPEVSVLVLPVYKSRYVLNTDSLMGGEPANYTVTFKEPFFVLEDKPLAVKIADALFALLDTELQEQTTSAIGGALQHNDNGGCIPEYFWNNTLSTKYHWATAGGTDELARMCGAIDGICSMGGDLVQVLGAASTFKTNFKKYLIFKVIDPEFGSAARWMGETEDQVKEFYALVTDEQQRAAFLGVIDSTISEIPDALKAEALKAWDNVSENPAYRAYYSGRAGVLIVSSCIGLSEVAAIARGGKISLVVMKAVMRQGRVAANLASKTSKILQAAVKLGRNKITILRDDRTLIEIVNGRLFVHDVEQLAEIATNNPNKNKVMLGRYSEFEFMVSFDREAGTDFTYFTLKDWDSVQDALHEGANEMWKVNEQFIRKEVAKGKDFYFSHDPSVPEAGSFFEREIKLLEELGVIDYKKVGKHWKATFNEQ